MLSAWDVLPLTDSSLSTGHQLKCLLLREAEAAVDVPCSELLQQDLGGSRADWQLVGPRAAFTGRTCFLHDHGY